MPVFKIKQNGEWINIAGGGGTIDGVSQDFDDVVNGTPNGINADTLDGKLASEYATKNYVLAEIEEAQLNSGGSVDLSNYATKDDISAFQTAEQVSSLINEALGVIENGSY